MRVLLVTPPMTQLNTPYPATGFLAGLLRARDIEVGQADLSLELALWLLSRQGIERITDEIADAPVPAVQWLIEEAEAVADTVELAITFLQGRDPILGHRICRGDLLPLSPRMVPFFEDPDEIEGLDLAFGDLGTTDRARFLATLFVDDIAEAITEGIDPAFALSRYGESLAAAQPSFDPLEQWLGTDSVVTHAIDEIARACLEHHEPELLGLSCPFPGNVPAALRIARIAKQQEIPVVLGGGYPNTELRTLQDPRLFRYVDYVTLDDGERPLLAIIEHIRGRRPRNELVRTWVHEDDDRVTLMQGTEPDLGPLEAIPTTAGLPLDRYLSLLEVPNPMHRLWSDGRWNKLMLAHGCYWKKCTFCDISLDYIARYQPADADRIVDAMQALIDETGQRGFHFVDEAAPPKLLRALSRRLFERGVHATWWTNIRFDKTFGAELCEEMADAGCVAVSGGLEVASDRLLKLMDKGVTVEQVARVTHDFTQAGIMVHAYLMYGFPTQTLQESVDALERVRQLFAAGCIQSAYWHRFVATVHSPVGREPQRFGVTLLPRPQPTFADNDVAFVDPTGCDHDAIGEGLAAAVYNYMHGVGLDWDVREFLPQGSPAAQVDPHLIEKALS